MDFDRLCCSQRINVVGTSGSGKSTFARQLAEALNLPCYEMDRLYWKPDWQSCSDEEMFQKVHDVTSQPSWVLDGNYTRTIPIKWQNVQLVIWLDLPFLRTLLRVTRRTLSRSLGQKELWPGTGNRETLARAFLSADSVIWWSITTHRPNRKKYVQLMQAAEYQHVEFIRLTSPKSVASFLNGMKLAFRQQSRH